MPTSIFDTPENALNKRPGIYTTPAGAFVPGTLETVDEKIARERSNYSSSQLGGMEAGVPDYETQSFELIQRTRKMVEDKSKALVESGLINRRPTEYLRTDGIVPATSLKAGQVAIPKQAPQQVTQEDPEAAAARHKQAVIETANKNLAWYVKAGVVADPMAGDPEQAQQRVRGIAAANKASVRTFSTMSKDERQDYLASSPGSRTRMESVRAVAAALEDPTVAVMPSDIQVFMDATSRKNENLTTARVDQNRLRSQVGAQVAEGSRAARGIVEDIKADPEFADMSPEQYRTRVAEALEKLPPVQKAEAMVVAARSKPEAIQLKEMQAIEIAKAEAEAEAKGRGIGKANVFADELKDRANFDSLKPSFLKSALTAGIAVPETFDYDTMKDMPDLQEAWVNYKATEAPMLDGLPVDRTPKRSTGSKAPVANEPLHVGKVLASTEAMQDRESTNRPPEFPDADMSADSVVSLNDDSGRDYATRIAAETSRLLDEGRAENVSDALKTAAKSIYDGERTKPPADSFDGFYSRVGPKAYERMKQDATVARAASMKQAAVETDAYLGTLASDDFKRMSSASGVVPELVRMGSEKVPEEDMLAHAQRSAQVQVLGLLPRQAPPTDAAFARAVSQTAQQMYSDYQSVVAKNKAALEERYDGFQATYAQGLAEKGVPTAVIGKVHEVYTQLGELADTAKAAEQVREIKKLPESDHARKTLEPGINAIVQSKGYVTEKDIEKLRVDNSIYTFKPSQATASLGDATAKATVDTNYRHTPQTARRGDKEVENPMAMVWDGRVDEALRVDVQNEEVLGHMTRLIETFMSQRATGKTDRNTREEVYAYPNPGDYETYDEWKGALRTSGGKLKAGSVPIPDELTLTLWNYVKRDAGALSLLAVKGPDAPALRKMVAGAAMLSWVADMGFYSGQGKMLAMQALGYEGDKGFDGALEKLENSIKEMETTPADVNATDRVSLRAQAEDASTRWHTESFNKQHAAAVSVGDKALQKELETISARLKTAVSRLGGRPTAGLTGAAVTWQTMAAAYRAVTEGGAALTADPEENGPASEAAKAAGWKPQPRVLQGIQRYEKELQLPEVGTVMVSKAVDSRNGTSTTDITAPNGESVRFSDRATLEYFARREVVRSLLKESVGTVRANTRYLGVETPEDLAGVVGKTLDQVTADVAPRVKNLLEGENGRMAQEQKRVAAFLENNKADAVLSPGELYDAAVSRK
jgi:hypothetical protein